MSWTAELTTTLTAVRTSSTRQWAWMPRKRSGRPISPASIARLSAVCCGSKVRMRPTCTSFRPPATSASRTRFASSMSTPRGFSQSTGLPASMQATARSAWVGSGEAMSTASTLGSPMSAAPESNTAAPPHSLERALARAWSTSMTATSSAPDTRCARFRAWRPPMPPVPTTPTRNASSAIEPPSSHPVLADPRKFCHVRPGSGRLPAGRPPRQSRSVQRARPEPMRTHTLLPKNVHVFVYNEPMKRRDLERALRRGGWTFLRHGGRHDIWTDGNREEAIPRHAEINERLARAILRRAGRKN